MWDTESTMKNKIIAVISLSILAGCSTTSKNQRVVNVEQWPTTTQSVQTVSHLSSQTTKASAEQVKPVCETDSMRQNVIDYDKTNDTVRIMTVQDSSGSSRVLSEVEVDCRDYFLRKSLAPADTNIVSVRTEVVEYPAEEPRRSTRVQNQRYTYIVQKGDTVWGIAREHCTTAKAISRLNGLGRGNFIDIGQRLKLPDEEC